MRTLAVCLLGAPLVAAPPLTHSAIMLACTWMYGSADGVTCKLAQGCADRCYLTHTHTQISFAALLQVHAKDFV